MSQTRILPSVMTVRSRCMVPDALPVLIEVPRIETVGRQESHRARPTGLSLPYVAPRQGRQPAPAPAAPPRSPLGLRLAWTDTDRFCGLLCLVRPFAASRRRHRQLRRLEATGPSACASSIPAARMALPTDDGPRRSSHGAGDPAFDRSGKPGDWSRGGGARHPSGLLVA